MNKQPILRLWQFVLLLSATSSCFAADQTPTMLRTLPDSGFTATALFTVGDRIGDYQPPGVLDGLAAFRQDDGTLRLFVNHELAPGAGYPFTLANGTQLVGSRISYMDIDPQTKSIVKAGPAFDRVRDRAGQTVTHARQINELPADNRSGLNDLCSAAGYRAGEFGFVDDLYFTHEEATARGNHPHGGSVWVLDINERELWALPELGRGSWENSAAVATPDMHEPDGHIALLLGDDLEFGGAPLYLWIGRKQPAGNLPARNGLSSGKLYVWVSDKKDRSADDWRGTGKTRNGQFVSIAARDINRAKQPGYDAAGYLDDLTLRKTARALGAFQFSRPEDLHTNPVDGQQVVFASTGHGREFPDDDWGTLYLIKMEFEQDKNGQLNASARLEILHDGDDFAGKGIRNPDNLVWAQDGNVYVQEDMATRLHRFGGKNKQETSTWRINPEKPKQFTRLAEIDRSVILPADATDTQANKLGKWESSGIIDVTEYFPAATGRVLLATVQAHSLRGGSLGGSNALVQGGQIILLEEHIAPE